MSRFWRTTGVLSINSGQASLANSILWGNGDGTLRGQAAGVNVSAEHSCVQGLPAVAGNNTGHNPLFVEGSFELTEGSPAIDTGDNAAVWPGVTTDLAGTDRFVNATGLASAAVDMGAYEFAPAATPNQCELDWNCDGVVDGRDLNDSVNNGGFYQDWQLYNAYHDHPVYGPWVEGGYYHKQRCGQPGNLDWDGNGVIEFRDVYGGNPTPANVDTFYTQIWLYVTYPHIYDNYYPDSGCP